MKKLSTVAVAAALVIGSHLSVMQNAQAFSFGSFNVGDSWGDSWSDGWGNSWGDGWNTNPRWGGYRGPYYSNPRFGGPGWGAPGGGADPRFYNGSRFGNGFSGPRFNFGDGDGFHWGNRSGPRWGNAPRWGAPPPWAYPPYYVPPAPPAKPDAAASESSPQK